MWGGSKNLFLRRISLVSRGSQPPGVHRSVNLTDQWITGLEMKMTANRIFLGNNKEVANLGLRILAPCWGADERRGHLRALRKGWFSIWLMRCFARLTRVCMHANPKPPSLGVYAQWEHAYAPHPLMASPSQIIAFYFTRWKLRYFWNTLYIWVRKGLKCLFFCRGWWITSPRGDSRESLSLCLVLIWCKGLILQIEWRSPLRLMSEWAKQRKGCQPIPPTLL